MTIGSVMKVKSIADAPLEAFCNTFDLHLSDNFVLKTTLWYFLEWLFYTGFTVHYSPSFLLLICIILVRMNFQSVENSLGTDQMASDEAS